MRRICWSTSVCGQGAAPLAGERLGGKDFWAVGQEHSRAAEFAGAFWAWKIG